MSDRLIWSFSFETCLATKYPNDKRATFTYKI